MKSFRSYLIPDGTKGLNKSHVNLDKDEDLHKFKKTLGHKE